MTSFSVSNATSAIIIILLIGSSYAQLSTNFYSKSCPNLLNVIKPVIGSAISQRKRNGASILRLFFHDCFVNGCDGSLLLADTPTFTGEQHARANNRSIRALKVIDKIKNAVEKTCPGVVSCADVLAIAARDSVVILGGPDWNVKLGRRDARTASITEANKNIPSPALNLSQLITSFKNQGLSTKDMVALSGAHTIGLARCTSYRPHIYNDTNIDPSFAKLRQSNCASTSGSSDFTLAPEDLQTPTKFDVKYYENLIKKKGLLHSDQELFNGGSTDSLVKKYSSSQATFFKDFVTGMIKMGDIKPLTGSKGEIRKVCSKINQLAVLKQIKMLCSVCYYE